MAKKAISPWLDFYSTPDRRMIINPYAFPGGVGPSPVLVASVNAGTIGGSGPVSNNIDTTGADLIVASIGWYSGGGATPGFTDSEANLWIPLSTWAGSVVANKLFYCFAPNTGAGHNFSNLSFGGFSSLCVAAFSGLVSSPFDVENGAAGSGTTLSTGSITPSQNNVLVVSGLTNENNSGGALSIDSGFTKTGTWPYANGVNEGTSFAYKILTAGGATNPQWTNGGSGADLAASIAAFKF